MRYLQEYWKDVSNIVEFIPNIENIYDKKILITGATGMVCSSVIDVIAWLNHNYNAKIHLTLAGRSKEKIADRFQDVLAENEYQYIEYDATKDQKIELKTNYIIHGASNANPAIYAKEPAETLLGNIVGLKSILEVAKNNQDARILYISSSEIYGNRKSHLNEFYKENEYGYIDILNPRACYPIGKRAAETLCACYLQEYNVDYVTVRLGHIYGPSITFTDTRASATFTKDAAVGRDIVMKSAGEQLRSYCYTLDCASAILTVLINGKCGEAYNISNKDSVASIRELAEALARAGGVKLRFEIPSSMEQRSYNLMNNSALNADKLEQLGWKAIFSLEDGARRTLKYYC